MSLKVYCQNLDTNQEHLKPINLLVYHGLADCFTNKLPLFYDSLSDYEKSRADRFRFAMDYSCYVSVHALLRIELSKRLGKKARSIVIAKSETGKPFLPDADLPFSLSRTKNLFAFVVGQSNQFLGVDIEQIKPDIDYENIGRNYFNEKEQQLMLSRKNPIEQKRTFFEIWTRKEALLKAIGVGINTEIQKVLVLDGGNMVDIDGTSGDSHTFRVATIHKKETLISVASSTDIVPELKNLSFVVS